ncbi:MAG: hypothetical protein ACYC46_10265 [Acidobacteriaceae bacterium]
MTSAFCVVVMELCATGDAAFAGMEQVAIKVVHMSAENKILSRIIFLIPKKKAYPAIASYYMKIVRGRLNFPGALPGNAVYFVI